MKTKFIKILALAIFGIATSLVGITPAQAVGDVCNSGAASAVKEAAGCPGYGNANALPGIIKGILNAVIAVSGLIAVIFIIVGGVNYMTSSGDVGKIQKAKSTILYAVIGLIICALSFAIVNFVIDTFLKQDNDAYVPTLTQKDIAFLQK